MARALRTDSSAAIPRGMRTLLTNAIIVTNVSAAPATYDIQKYVPTAGSGTDLAHPVEVRSTDELGLLAESFNRMREALRSARAEIEGLLGGQHHRAVHKGDRVWLVRDGRGS